MTILDLGEADALVQVAALPWRLTSNGQLRVLLITSRRNKKWMLPKGWQMKGKADHEAAMIEAREEAGAVGISSPIALGSYRYPKLSGNGDARIMAATIYPLHVQALLDDWREKSERQRRWFSPGKAANAVFERDLARFLMTLSPDALAHVQSERESGR